MQFHVLNFLPVVSGFYWFFPRSWPKRFAMAKTQPCYPAYEKSYSNSLKKFIFLGTQSCGITPENWTVLTKIESSNYVMSIETVY